MSKYTEELQKEAEKLAYILNPYLNEPWTHDYDRNSQIKDMLPIARYVLEARAESYTIGRLHDFAELDTLMSTKEIVELIKAEQTNIGYIEQKEGTEK